MSTVCRPFRCAIAAISAICAPCVASIRKSIKNEKMKLVLLHIIATSSIASGGWVDPDTPEKYLTTKSFFPEDTREYNLVRNETVVSYLNM